jgi:hypothetical protein
MKNVIFFLFILIQSNQSFSQHFNGTWLPVDYIGTEDHFRCLWFSDDNKTVYGNNNKIVAFNVADGKMLSEVTPAGGAVHKAEISSDRKLWMCGRHVRNSSNDPKYGYMKPQFETYDFTSKKFKTQQIGTKFITRAVFSKIKNTAYAHSSLSGDEQIVEFQIDPFEVKRIITHESTKQSTYIYAFAVNEEKNILAYSVGGDSKELKIVDLTTGKLIKSLLSGEEIAEIQFTPDGNTIIAAAFADLFVIDLATYSSKKFNIDIDSDGMYIFEMAIHPNNRSVVVSCKWGTSVVDTKNGAVKKIDKGNSFGCGFSKNGQYLVISIKPFGDKTTTLRIFQDKQFINANFGNSPEKDEIIKDYAEEDPKEEVKNSFEYTSAIPGFSITCPFEPTESRKQTKKDRLLLSVKSTSNKMAATLTVMELSSSFKQSKYQKLSEDVAKNFVSKKEYEIIKKESVVIEGQKGIHYLLKRNNLYYDYRGVTLNGYNYQMVFIYDQKIKDLEPLSTFFNSFKLK